MFIQKNNFTEHRAVDSDVSLITIFDFSLSRPQSHGHSHYPSEDRYSSPDGDVEEGEKEKLQQNGEASNLALGKVDAGEGELMLSPAQPPQVGFRRKTISSMSGFLVLRLLQYVEP